MESQDSRAWSIAGHAGSVLVAAAAALRFAEPAGARLHAWTLGRRPPRTDVVDLATVPPTQFATYVAGLAVFFAVALLGVAAIRAASGRGARVVSAALFGSAIAIAWASSTFFVDVAPVVVLLAATLVAPHVGRERDPARGSPRAQLVAWVLSVEVATTLWGAWLVLFQDGRAFALAAIAVVGAACSRLARGLRAPDALARDVVAASPLLLTPLLGLKRAPGPWWIVAFTAAVAALAVFADRPRVRALLSPERLAMAAAWSVLAIYVLPCGFRELPSVNMQKHEAGQLAWIGHALTGKMLMADVGTIYGPLRAYIVGAWLLVFGRTVEQARLAQLFVNLAALGVFVAIAWELGRRRVWTLVFAGYLLLACTYAGFWLDVGRDYSFGWADLGRAVFPIGFAYLVPALVAGRPDAPDQRAVLAAAIAGVFAWYAQEMALPTLAAILVAVAADRASSRLRGGPGARSFAASRDGAIVLAAYVMGVLAFVAPYALRGRLKLLLSTAAYTAALFASGAYAALSVPFGAGTFRVFGAATTQTGAGEGTPLQWIAPFVVLAFALVVLAVRAVNGRWSPRSTRLLAVVTIGLLGERAALGRADHVHQLFAAVPAVLVLVALVADAADAVAERRSLPRPLGALGLALVVWLSSSSAGAERSVLPRTKALLRGDEHPSIGAPYVYDDVPRAGDVRVPAGDLELVRLIQQRTGRREPIFVRTGFLTGAELYFLADRRNPTRFDVLCEIATHELQDETRRAIEAQPPTLVIGSDRTFVGPETARFFDERYRVLGTYGGQIVAELR